MQRPQRSPSGPRPSFADERRNSGHATPEGSSSSRNNITDLPLTDSSPLPSPGPQYATYPPTPGTPDALGGERALYYMGEKDERTPLAEKDKSWPSESGEQGTQIHAQGHCALDFDAGQRESMSVRLLRMSRRGCRCRSARGSGFR